MSSLFCCSHHLWKAEASKSTWGHMRRRNKPHRKGQRLKSLQNQVNVGEQRSNCFLFCFLLINERMVCNGTWTMLARHFYPFELFLNVRTGLTMHVYIALCQGPKAASIAWWTCIHVIISSEVAPCVEIPFFSLFKCFVLYLKSPYLFLFFGFFFTPCPHFCPLFFLRITELSNSDNGSQMEDTNTFLFSCSLSLILKIEGCLSSLISTLRCNFDNYILFTFIFHASQSVCPPSPHTS